MVGGLSTSEAIGDVIVAECRAWIGTPYCHRACVRGVGCDCLGLVRAVWRRLHGSEPMTIPAYSTDWQEAGSGRALLEAVECLCPPVAEIRQGDLLLFGWRRNGRPRHCGISSAPFRFIHVTQHNGVHEVALDGTWRRRLQGAYRFPSPHSLPVTNGFGSV